MDLFVFDGPLSLALHRQNETDNTQDSPTVLEIYGERVSRNQLKRRAAELQTLGVHENAEAAAEQDIIAQAILRLRARYNDKRIPRFSNATVEAVRSIASRATSEEDFTQWLTQHGYTQESYSNKLHAIMRQQHYLENTLQNRTEVSDGEVAAITAQIADYLAMPERRTVQHIFFSTINRDINDVRIQAENVLQQLQSAPDAEALKAQFAAFAEQYSEDNRTAHSGGNLGTIPVYPQHPLQELNLFGENSIPADVPVLKQSKWGWHIVLAGALEEARPLTEDECRESIRTALRSYKNSAAVDTWIYSNIQEARQKNNIKTHAE